MKLKTWSGNDCPNTTISRNEYCRKVEKICILKEENDCKINSLFKRDGALMKLMKDIHYRDRK